MCGIFGKINSDQALSSYDIENCRKALSAISHRGPDAEGEWYDSHVYMGHRRLNIIDLSEAANQPFQDESGRYVLSYNGEIYNYIELRQELETFGVKFNTRSDTEVFLAAWIFWGIEALQRYDGMFAAAIHDRKTNIHYLIRDGIGQKPLYYCERTPGLIYASELGSLLKYSGLNWSLDREAFARYLLHSYYGLEETPIAGVKKLLPGHYLQIKGKKVERFQYWNSIPSACNKDIDEDQALNRFRQLFESSCRMTMRSDVPYGVFLSGGIDSSLILKACHKVNDDVCAFSVASSEKDFDEREKAVLMAEELKIKTHKIFQMDSDAVSGAVQQVFTSSDEPHGDPGYVNTSFLAHSAKPYVTVGLAGDGGDELFAGYAPFRGLAAVPWFRNIPAPIVYLLKKFLRSVPQSDKYMSLGFKARCYLQGFPSSEDMRFPMWLASAELSHLKDICTGLSQDFFSADGHADTILSPIKGIMQQMEGRTQQQMLLYYYQKIFLPEFVCLHTDRAAMRVGMEVRSPFLSKPLVEFANSLPDDMKIRSHSLKWLLKRSAEAYEFPPEICSQTKRGFTFPIARWLKGPLKSTMEEMLSPEALNHQLVDHMQIKNLVDNHISGKQNNYRIIYNLMAFQAWYQRHPEISAS